jgi:hypothetical protein
MLERVSSGETGGRGADGEYVEKGREVVAECGRFSVSWVFRWRGTNVN